MCQIALINLVLVFLLLEIILVCYVTRSTTIGPKCYQCDHVANPNDCDHYEQCSDGERCFVQRFMGQQLNEFYKLGCMSNSVCSMTAFSLFGSFVGKRQTGRSAYSHATETYHKKREEDFLLLCLQCCDGYYCNVDGKLCGTVAATGLPCLDCKDVVDPTHCDKYTTCQPHHKCLLHVYYSPNAGDLRYEMRCEKNSVCTVLENTISSSQDHVSCAACCDDRPYCNLDLCEGVKASLHSNYTGWNGTQIQPGTANTVVTQSPTFSVQISGNHVNQPYKGAVTLQCQTSQTAVKTWYFNGLQSLPTGIRIDTGTMDLHIDSLDENTFGNYTCVASSTSNPTSLKSTTTDVSINPEAPIITSFKASPQQPGIHAQVNLTCEASGYPTDITFEWAFTSSGGTTPPPFIQYRNISMGQVLEIGGFETHYHQGTFTCTARNSAGTSQPGTLVLQEKSQPIG